MRTANVGEELLGQQVREGALLIVAEVPELDPQSPHRWHRAQLHVCHADHSHGYVQLSARKRDLQDAVRAYRGAKSRARNEQAAALREVPDQALRGPVAGQLQLTFELNGYPGSTAALCGAVQKRGPRR